MRKKMDRGFRCFMVWLPLVLLWGSTANSSSEKLETYIIHMDHTLKPTSFSTYESWHRSTLSSISPKEDRLLYSYTHAIHGFSARLTPSELLEIEKLPTHRATYRERYAKMFTTYTPTYLGLAPHSGLWPAASFGSDIIIGILDTGVWPESKSFNDRGMSPVPGRWKGACENGTKFNSSLCNRKLIGARSFSKGLKASGINVSTEYDFDSPRDFFGHGTHTISTAGGAHVSNADYFGYAEGTAKGVAPAARVAMYKVLWASDTMKSAATDVLAGMDQAIADGVDIMSLSIGLDVAPYYEDVIAIGALSAVARGIFVACAAGNSGGHNSTYNGAPWITTVGAGTVDRRFMGEFTIGGHLTVEGITYFPESLYILKAHLYYGKDDANKATCQRLSLNHTDVAGKVVLCDGNNTTEIFGQISEIIRTKAKAGIFLGNGLFLEPEDFNFPILVLPPGGAADSVRDYAKTTPNATVTDMRFKITKTGTKPAPQVAYFSSRGPDPISPSILKPDILAPGNDVLAAWIPDQPFMSWGSDSLITDYALLSGTSMASPHVAGVAALLRAVHKEWSPAAIRSAIMTTATTVDNMHSTIGDQWMGSAATPLDFGAGQINPNNAMDPGLVYDMGFQDYVNFLCGLRYDKNQMRAVIRLGDWSCETNYSDLNYPSFMALFSNTSSFPIAKNFSRIVTNVGEENSVYEAVYEVPKGMRIKAEPEKLTFSSENHKLGFVLSVEAEDSAFGDRPMAFGYLKWVDQKSHFVSSPVVLLRVN